MAATTYANTIWAQVIDPLHDLLVGNFAAVLPIYFDNVTPAKGSEWVVVTPLEDNEVERTQKADTRRYTLRLDYFLRTGGAEGRLTQLLCKRVEQIKHLLFVSGDHDATGAAYYWHDGVVQSVNYEATTDEHKAAGFRRVTISRACTTTEIYA